jgi:hypothetical protein
MDETYLRHSRTIACRSEAAEAALFKRTRASVPSTPAVVFEDLRLCEALAYLFWRTAQPRGCCGTCCGMIRRGPGCACAEIERTPPDND